MHALALFTGLMGAAHAACPYMTGEMPNSENIHRRDDGDAAADTEEFLSKYYLNDKDSFMTSDVGGPIEDQNSLSAGERGPTLLEDFIFRQKIQRFDHERVGIISLTVIKLLASNFVSVLGPRARGPRPRRWSSWCLYFLRRLVEYHRSFLPWGQE